MQKEKITVLAHAKLNLYLDITGVRADGFHTLETVMQSVDLCDVIVVEKRKAPVFSVSCSDPNLPQGEGNIAHKAAKFFSEAAGLKTGADIRVEKRIPILGGMGGGSADAAGVLTALNIMSGEPFSKAELTKLGAQIGADVPFCVNGGVAVCRGIGDEIEPLPAFTEWTFLVVMPPFGFSTEKAYKRYDENPVKSRGGLSEFINSGSNYPGLLYNVFEQVYSDPRITEIKKKLLSHGAVSALLTGSGAAIFGVFTSASMALAAAKHFPDCHTTVCKPSPEGITVL